MILTKVFEQFTVRGEFEGQPFEADYSGEDGWNAGNGIVCLNDDFIGTDEHEDWCDRLSEILWDRGLLITE